MGPVLKGQVPKGSEEEEAGRGAVKSEVQREDWDEEVECTEDMR